MSQRNQILADLKAGRRITHKGAIDAYGCGRLSARILELRRSGHDINTRFIQDGRKRYAEYWLPERAGS